jgi:RNA polymerase subunit RPABC4/transcription elongation factor Spt4
MGIGECSNCHGLLDDGAKACEQCGKPVSPGEIRKVTPAIDFGSVTPAPTDQGPYATYASRGSSDAKAELMSAMGNQHQSNLLEWVLGIAISVVVIAVIIWLSKHYQVLTLFLLGAIIPSVIAGYYVGKRTGNALNAALWALVLGPAGVLIGFVLPDRTRYECPQCAELVRHSASVCPHCRSEL